LRCSGFDISNVVNSDMIGADITDAPAPVLAAAAIEPGAVLRRYRVRTDWFRAARSMRSGYSLPG
jgi:hypothetical protein